MGNNLVELDGIFENGYGFIAKNVMQDKELSLQAKGIYAYLCSFSGKGKDAFPSRKKICDDLNISNDTLGKYLNEIKEKGYISIVQSKNEQSKFANNIYKINLKVPYPKISVSEELDTNNNILLNNNKINKENIKEKKEQENIELNEHFEKIVKRYPAESNQGKTKAQQYFLQWIKGKTVNGIKRKLTDKQMYLAVAKYAKQCEANKTDQQYIKRIDNFFKETILDYVEDINE